MKKILLILMLIQTVCTAQFGLTYSPQTWNKVPITGESIMGFGNTNGAKLIFGSNGSKMAEYTSTGKLYGWSGLGVNCGFGDWSFQSTMNYILFAAGRTGFGYHKAMPSGLKSGIYWLDLVKQNASDISRIRFTKDYGDGVANVPNWYIEHGDLGELGIKRVNTDYSVDSTSSLYINNGYFSFGRSTPIGSSKFSFQGAVYSSANITTALNLVGNALFANNFIMNNGATNNYVLTTDVNGVGTWQENKAVTNLSVSSGLLSFRANGVNYATSLNSYNDTRYLKLAGGGTVSGSITASQFLLSASNTAPSSATDTGTAYEIRVTAAGIYYCYATNSWVKFAPTTF